MISVLCVSPCLCVSVCLCVVQVSLGGLDDIHALCVSMSLCVRMSVCGTGLTGWSG